MDSFIAIDYETANSNYLSACALGISFVEKGVVLDTIQTFIKPPKEFSSFDPFNIMIHKIEPIHIKNAPSFETVWEVIEKFHSQNKVPFACHYSGFDIRVTEALLKYYNISFQEIHFYDTFTVARKMWPEFSNHKLNHLAHKFSIKLDHHNASSDAQACALIALKQIEVLGKKSLSEVAQNYGFKLGLLNSTGVKTMSDFKHYGGGYFGGKADSSKGIEPSKEVNTGSDLYGKRVVFTGELSTLTREVAIQRAVDNGAIVNSAVSGKTNFLVVGVSDLIDFNEGRKTRKLQAAETFSNAGHDISIIDEEDFLRLTT
jgi:DNA polymerase-3 subunit epsilon